MDHVPFWVTWHEKGGRGGSSPPPPPTLVAIIVYYIIVLLFSSHIAPEAISENPNSWRVGVGGGHCRAQDMET